MSINGLGVVSRQANEPALLEEIVIDPPGPGEVLVTMQASGVCHTDLHYKQGKISDDFPFLLGHEGAGIVEEVGEGVTSPGKGDYVVLAWRAPLRPLPVLLHRPAAPLLPQPHRPASHENQGRRPGAQPSPGPRTVFPSPRLRAQASHRGAEGCPA